MGANTESKGDKLRNKNLEIKGTLGELSNRKQVAFGASCCERLLPNYYAFSVIERSGDFPKLRSILDRVWKGLVDESASGELHCLSWDELIQLAPDTEDFSSLFTSLAGDAVSAVASTVRAYLDPANSLDNVVAVIDIMQDTVFQYLAIVNEPDLEPHKEEPLFEEKILALPLMLAELEWQ